MEQNLIKTNGGTNSKKNMDLRFEKRGKKHISSNTKKLKKLPKNDKFRTIKSTTFGLKTEIIQKDAKHGINFQECKKKWQKHN